MQALYKHIQIALVNFSPVLCRQEEANPDGAEDATTLLNVCLSVVLRCN